MPGKSRLFFSKYKWYISALLVVVVVVVAVVIPVVLLTGKPACKFDFPNGMRYSASEWDCSNNNESYVPATEKFEPETECRRRCGQAQTSQGFFKCETSKWVDENPICVDNEQELLYFFTTTRKNNRSTTSIQNPKHSQHSNFLDAGIFNCKKEGLHLFSLTVETGEVESIQLKHNDNVIATITKGVTKTNSISVAVNLAKDDTVTIEGDGDLTFTGVSLYSPSHKPNSKCLWGSRIKKLEVQNIDQPIILQDVNDENGVDYDRNTGKVKIETDGVYMITLNLGSDDSSYGSMDVNNVKTLGLGEDRDGKNVMSNFFLKEFKVGDTIKLTLEALGKIYDDNKETQLTVTSLIDEVKDWSFCAYSSHYKELQTLDTVKFDKMFLPNENFDTTTGIFTHPYEKFNPKRFYLLSTTALIGKLKNSNSAIIKIEQETKHGFITLASATTSSTMRSMLQVTVIAQMDQQNDKIRVRAEGFMDEGPDVHFATFCGFRLGT